MDAGIDLDQLFSDEILSILSTMTTEPTSPTLFSNVEAELTTVCAECSKEELDKLTATGPGLLSQGVTGLSVESQHAVPGSNRMKLSASSNTINSASTSTKASQIRKQVRVFAPLLTDNEMERVKRSAIPDSTTADTKYCIKL